MVKKYMKLAFLLAAITVSSVALAQQPAKPVKPVAIPVVKFKPPVVKTSWGRLTGSNATCFPEEIKQLVTFPIKVMDAKNNSYSIASYHLVYKRIGVTEDEATGKTSPATDQVGREFTATPLPGVWQTNISEQLHKGEELYFYDIVVYDKQGRRFNAPELKITIE